jgi:prevent-host-death family protein
LRWHCIQLREKIDLADQSDHIGAMKSFNIGTLEAKTRLSELLEAVQQGSTFVITRHGKPIAQLRPIAETKPQRRAGFAKGLIAHISDDFEAPLKEFADYM